MDELMLKIDHVTKCYRLGVIGSTTLRDELQRRSARRHHREDPTRKIGSREAVAGELFKALDDVSLDIRKGERVGIIGRNGAGKSTLLKLIARITAPTEGDIWLNGRVASMLEVGTGFNDELTGRENIYMNGAILGMKRREIDAKLERIIEFSECRQFIDTPVKRYSSGMRVKLAFAVAAHLDAEIMIMDEVLAVGDMAFQRKCIQKMAEVSEMEDRTILYVSHNMATIRHLCDRVVVLEEGRVAYDGDVDEGIARYLESRANAERYIDLRTWKHGAVHQPGRLTLTHMECLSGDSNAYELGASIDFRLGFEAADDVEAAHLRIIVKNMEGDPVTMATTITPMSFSSGEERELEFTLDATRLAPARYTVNPVLYEVDEQGHDVKLDVVDDIYSFEIVAPPEFNNNMPWRQRSWGYIYSEPLELRGGDEHAEC